MLGILRIVMSLCGILNRSKLFINIKMLQCSCQIVCSLKWMETPQTPIGLRILHVTYSFQINLTFIQYWWQSQIYVLKDR